MAAHQRARKKVTGSPKASPHQRRLKTGVAKRIQTKGREKMTNAKPKPDVPAAGAEAVPAGNVDKIRDILFGTQMQDYDRRFTQLEKRVEKGISDLRDDTVRRLESLEKYIKHETETLLGQLKSEAEERTTGVKELNRELAETGKKLRQLTEQTAAASRELHAQMLEQSKTLRNELTARHTELSADLTAATGELRGDKTGREELAALLLDVAKRLSVEGGGNIGKHLKDISDA